MDEPPPVQSDPPLPDTPLFPCPFCSYPKPPGICPECGKESAAGRKRSRRWGRVLIGSVVLGLVPVCMTALELVVGTMLREAKHRGLANGEPQPNATAFAVWDVMELSHLVLVPLLCIGMTVFLLVRCCRLRDPGAPWRVAAFLGLGLVLCVPAWVFGFAFIFVNFSPD